MGDRDFQAIWRSLDPDAPGEVRWVRPVGSDRATLLLGAFDPPTNAHIALAHAGSRATGDPAVLCLTKVLLARPDDELIPAVARLGVLDDVCRTEGFGLAVSNRGTYLDVARALRTDGIHPSFIIGSDKLTQLEDPDFYVDGALGVKATFDELRLLVVPRAGMERTRSDVTTLDPRDVFTHPTDGLISASLVRRRVRRGEPVDGLVPPGVASRLEGYTSAR